MKENNNSSINMHLPETISKSSAVLLSKYVGAESTKEKLPMLDVNALEAISKGEREKASVTKDIMDLFPDVEFCADTVARAILSPNDSYTRGVNLSLPNISISTELKSLLTNEITSQLKFYKFEETQADIIKKSLFINGSHAEVFIPEAALSTILESDGEITLESYGERNKKDRMKITDKPMIVGELSMLTKENAVEDKTFYNESLENVLNVEVTDDISNINDASFESYLVMKKMKYKTKSLTTEDATRSEILKNIFRNPDKYKTMTEVKVNEYLSSKRENLGRPLHLRVEHYAIKPIWAGTPDNHIGYNLIIDERGNPIREDSLLENNDEDLPGLTGVTSSTVSKLLTKAESGLKTMTGNDKEIPNSEEIYGRVLEEMLLNKIERSPLKNVANFNDNQNFNRIMFNRAMKGKKTKILFLPKNLVTYYAYDFKSNGIGKSKVEKVSILYSMRAIMLFGTLMANIKNSIPITEVSAVLDPDTPNVESAMKMIIKHVMQNRQLELPIGMPKTQDLVTWVRHLGLVFNIDHPQLPDTKVTSTDSSRNVVVPTDTVTEKLEELIYMQYGMNREQVINGMKDADTATSIHTQNKFFLNRAMYYQDKTIPLQSRHVSTIIENDAVIRNSLEKIINEYHKQSGKGNTTELQTKFNLTEEEMTDTLIELIIEDITVVLPKPESNEGNSLSKAMSEYSNTIDTYLESQFNPDVLSAEVFGEEASESSDSIKAAIKSMMLREWAVENNFMKGYTKFTTLDEEGSSCNDYLSKYSDINDTLGKLIKEYISKNIKRSKNLDNDLGAVTEKVTNKIEKENEKNNQVPDDNGGDVNTNTGDEPDNNGNPNKEDEGVQF